MSTSIFITALVAGAAQKARDEAEQAFRAAGATAAADARTLADLGLEQNTAIDTLVYTGIVRVVDADGKLTASAPTGLEPVRYFLDEKAIVAEQSAAKVSGARAKRIAIAVTIALTLVLVALAFLVPDRGAQ